jgi:hypothetical protein
MHQYSGIKIKGLKRSLGGKAVAALFQEVAFSLFSFISCARSEPQQTLSTLKRILGM